MKKRYYFSCKNWLGSGVGFLFLAIISFNLQAQIAPAKLWDKSFGGSNNDSLTALKQTSDGGYILGCFSNSGIGVHKTHASRGSRDYWVIKLDASGNRIWDKTYGGQNIDGLTALQQTSDGGYILGGQSESGISGDKTQVSQGSTDFWVIKLDGLGNKVWDKTFGGSGSDNLTSLQQTTDGGYILGGSSNSGSGGDKTQVSKGNYDFWVIKLDASGNKIWDKTIGGSNSDLLHALQQTSDGGYILGGSSLSGISGDKSQVSKGNADYWVVKLDGGGNKIWDKTYGGHNYDLLTSLQQTSDGGYILGGSSRSGNTGDRSQALRGRFDYWVVKLNALGNKTWDRAYGGNYYDYLYSLQQTSDGGYMLGGKSQSGISGEKTQANQGNWDYWVVKLNALGNKIWDNTLGGNNHDHLASLQQTSDGGYILGGASKSDLSGDKSQASNGNFDCWVIKLAPAPSNDVAVSAISGVNSGCGLTSQETITIAVSNWGTAAQNNIPVSYKINNGTPVTEVVAGPLAPYTSVNYSFTTKADLSSAGTYSIEARTNLINDALSANDVFIKTVTSYAVPSAPLVTASGSLAICFGDSVTLTAFSSGSGSKFTWFENGNIIPGATSATYTTKTAGSYTVTVTANGCVSASSLASNVTMVSVPPKPTITQAGFVLTSSSNSGNQWYKDNVAIAGATAQTFTATSNGSYTVAVSDNGCSSQPSNAVVIGATGLGADLNGLKVAVYPNPSNGIFNITLPEGSKYDLTLTDLTGKVIRKFSTKDYNLQLNISNVGKGVYFLEIAGEGKTAMRKLIVE